MPRTDPAPHRRPRPAPTASSPGRARPAGRRARRAPAALLAALLAVLVGVGCGTADRGDELRGGATRVPSDEGDAALAAEASQVLAGPLLGAAAQANGENVAVSPWLAATQLAVLRTGAAGDTRAALDGALGTAAVDDAELLRSVGALDDALVGRAGEQRSAVRKGTIELLPAEALWVQRGTNVSEAWLDRLAAGTGGGLRTVDFRSDPEGARQAVNGWAADATDGQIDQLAPRGSVTADTRLLAASTLWLQAPWDEPFPAERTADAPFALADGSEAAVPTMQLVPDRRLRWAAGDGLEAVELPYLGDQLRVVVLVPTTGDVVDLVAGLDAGRLDDLLDDLRTEPVSVALPRFAFTTQLDLIGPYEALGLGQLFVPDEADLSPLAPAEGLALSDAVQQVFASVDEEGTQTSAATVEREASPADPGAARIEADRPFAFLVVDGPTRAVLQAGVVRDPRA